MKQISTVLLINLLFFFTAIPLKAQFSADMHLKKGGEQHIYKVYHDGTSYRYDFEEEGTPLAVLVHPGKDKTHVLFPKNKMYQEMNNQSTRSLSNDPVQTMRYLERSFSVKKLEKEQVNGFECEKREISTGNQLLNTNWYSEALNFPVKMKQPKQYTMELKNIKQNMPDKRLFKVPEDYTLVDNRMNPVSPEPPPPESWNSQERNIPFKGDFTRGDQVEMSIPESKNYKLIYTNQGEKITKVVFEIRKEGEMLPLSKQGPIDFRTKKVHPGKNKSTILSLTSGNALLLKVYYGKAKIEVIPE